LWQSFVFGIAMMLLITGILRLFRPYFEFDPAARMISMKTFPARGRSDTAASSGAAYCTSAAAGSCTSGRTAAREECRSCGSWPNRPPGTR